MAGYWLGVIYYNRKDYINANKLFEKVVNLYPLDYDSGIMLAWTKLKLTKLARSQSTFSAYTPHCDLTTIQQGLKLVNKSV